MTLDETNMEVDDPLFVKDNSIPGGRCPRDILCIISTHCMEKGINKKKNMLSECIVQYNWKRLRAGHACPRNAATVVQLVVRRNLN